MPFEASNKQMKMKEFPSKKQQRGCSLSMLVDMFLDSRNIRSTSPYRLSVLWIEDFLRFGENATEGNNNASGHIRPIVLATGSAGEQVSRHVYEILAQHFGTNDKLYAVQVGAVCGNNPLRIVEVEKSTPIGKAIESDILFALTSSSNYVSERDLKVSRIVDKDSKIGDLRLLPSECVVTLDASISSSAPILSKTHSTNTPLGHVGLVSNFDYSFLTSALQAILHIPQLISIFTNKDLVKSIITMNDPLGYKGKIALGLSDLFCQYYSTPGSLIDTKKFLNTISEVYVGFTERIIHDPYIFTQLILNCLHEDLNNTNNSIRHDETIKHKSNRSNTLINLHDDSCIRKLFSGMMKETMKCTNCQSITSSVEPFFDMTLQIPGERSLLRDVVIISNNNDLSPMRTRVVIPHFGTIGEVKRQISEIIPEITVDNTELIACEVFDGKVVEIFTDGEVVVDVLEDCDDLVIYQVAKPCKGEVILPCCICYDSVGFGLPFFLNINCDKLTWEISPYVISIKHEIEAKLRQQANSPPQVEEMMIHSGSYKLFNKNVEQQFGKSMMYRWNSSSCVNMSSERYPRSPTHITRKSRTDSEDANLDKSKPGILIIQIGDHAKTELILAKEIMNKRTISSKEKGAKSPPISVSTPYLSPASSSPPESSSDPISVEDCILESSTKKTLQEPEIRFCKSCDNHCLFTRSSKIWNTPEILMIHLQRFGPRHDISRKIEDLVSFPTSGLDINPFMSKKSPNRSSTVYDLIAVNNCENTGFRGNSFTCTVRDVLNKQQWMQFRDSFISPVEDVVTSEGYILYYVRRKDSAVEGCIDTVAHAERAVKKLRDETHMSR